MYWYIVIVVLVLFFVIFLYITFSGDEDDDDEGISAEDFSSPEAEEKIDKLVKKDVSKARKIIKNDLKIFDAIQRSETD